MTHKRSTKEEIIAIAGEDFSRFGYDAASLEEIAKSCGISKPAIYYHFKDKASLYEAVLLREFTQLRQIIDEGIQKDDPVEALRAYIRLFGDYVISNPTFAAHFSREIANDAKSLPDSCVLELSKTLEMLVSLLKKGNEQGVFSCENPFMVQMMIVTTLNAYMTTNSLRRRVYTLFDTTHEILDPKMDDIIDNLCEKIVKALTC